MSLVLVEVEKNTRSVVVNNLTLKFKKNLQSGYKTMHINLQNGDN